MQRIVIRNLPEAMNLVKEMHLGSDDEWTGDYRMAANGAIAQFLKDRMDEPVCMQRTGRKVTHHLSWAHECSISDRKTCLPCTGRTDHITYIYGMCFLPSPEQGHIVQRR